MNRRKNAQRKLLVVEGDTLIASELKQQLEELGFKKLSFCYNVNDCLRILRTELPPDLIIIDISLKGTPNAIDLAEKLTNDIRIPFVFSTSADQQALYEKASNTIPYGIVIKPFNPALLEFTLETCFDLIELRRLLMIKNEDLVYANKLINLQKDDLLKSFESARDLQNAILPETEGLSDFFKAYFMINKPKSLIGGDFFWQYRLNDNELLFGVMDCTGHAVSGALMSILIHTYLHNIVKEYGVSEPADILWLLDKRLLNQTIDADPNKSELGAGMDAILCHYNKKGNKLRFSGARRPLVHVSKGKMNIHKGYRAPIGLYSMDQKEFEKHQIELKDGDRIILFTDGFVDQIGEFSDSKFKARPLYDLLESNKELSLYDLEKLLIETHNSWKGRMEQTDDILISCLSF